MLYLLFSVLSSVANAGILKRGEMVNHDRLVVMGMNYTLATFLASAIWFMEGSVVPGGITIGLGIVGGIFYAVGLFAWMGAIKILGLATSTTTMRMSVLLPTLLSIVVFGELPSIFHLLGIFAAVVAIALIAIGGSANRIEGGGRAVFWLLSVFICAGGAHVTLKLFTELGPPQEKEALLALIFLSAGIMTWAVVFAGKHRMKWSDAISGSFFGLFNVTSNSFLLLALQTVSGVVAFPLVNMGILLGSGFLGIVVWRERPGLPGFLAIGIAAAAIVLLNF